MQNVPIHSKEVKCEYISSILERLCTRFYIRVLIQSYNTNTFGQIVPYSPIAAVKRPRYAEIPLAPLFCAMKLNFVYFVNSYCMTAK